MINKIVVGITQRVDKVESYDEWRDALDQKLIDWVTQSGFVPVPIPNMLVAVDLPDSRQLILNNWLDTVQVNAILLSGGNNIGDIENRDITEKCLLSWAEKYRKPVLGICRGMQMMGIYAGEKLIKVDGHVQTRHQLQIKNSYSLPESINSYHDFALDNCPNGFEILAESEEGSIEAIKHKELPWEGWMWHPERERQFDKISINRFKKLMNNGK